MNFDKPSKQEWLNLSPPLTLHIILLQKDITSQQVKNAWLHCCGSQCSISMYTTDEGVACVKTTDHELNLLMLCTRILPNLQEGCHVSGWPTSCSSAFIGAAASFIHSVNMSENHQLLEWAGNTYTDQLLNGPYLLFIPLFRLAHLISSYPLQKG